MTDLTFDTNAWHLQPDKRGRVIVHGLLVASLLTKIAARLGYMARTFDILFARPVFSGEEITCVCTVTEISEAEHAMPTGGDNPAVKRGVTRLSAESVFTNSEGAVVARIVTTGLISKPLAETLAIPIEPNARL